MSFISQMPTWQKLKDLIGLSDSPISLNNQKIINLADPEGPADAATKRYVDSASILSPVINASCTADDAVGSGVYIHGPKIGPNYQVRTVDITDSAKMPMIGLIIEKLSPTLATVQLRGEVIGLFTNLITSKIYFISEQGTPTHLVPQSPSVGVKYLQNIGVALSDNILFLHGSLNLLKQRG